MDALEEDTLFLALTRPALMWGIPLDAALLIAVVAVALLLAFGNPIFALGVGAGLFGVSRLIVRRDPNQFRIFSMYGRTKAAAPNKHLWRGSSYAPLPSQIMKRKGFARVPV